MHIRKGWEFRRVYRAGGRAQGPYLSVVVCRNEFHHSRLGLSVGKKLGPAVRRNKLKRLVREAYRLTRWEIETRAGNVDVVVIPNQGPEKFPLEDLMQELPLLCERAAQKAGKRRRRARTGKSRAGS